MFDIKRDKTINSFARKYNIDVVENINDVSFKKGKIIFRRSKDRSKDDYINDVFHIIDSYFDSNKLIYFFIDEIAQYSNKMNIPDPLEKLFTMGLGVGKIGVWSSQRIQSVHNDIITQTENYFIFRVHSWDFNKMCEYGFISKNKQDTINRWLKNKYHFTYYDGIENEFVRPI